MLMKKFANKIQDTSGLVTPFVLNTKVGEVENIFSRFGRGNRL